MRASAAILSLRLAGALLLGLLPAEAAARLALGLGTPPLSVPHPTIEYRLKPDRDLLRFGSRVAILKLGMRSDPLHEKAPGELLILVFGDSVVSAGRRGQCLGGQLGPCSCLACARELGFFSSDIIVLMVSSYGPADVPTFEPIDPSTHPTVTPVLALQELLQRCTPTASGGTRQAMTVVPRVVVLQYPDREEVHPN
jgi:hypothetical protein